MSDGLLTVKEVAILLRVSDESVYRLCRSKRLRATRVGGLWRIPRESVAGILGGNQELEVHENVFDAEQEATSVTEKSTVTDRRRISGPAVGLINIARTEAALSLRADGLTYQAIAKRLGVTRQRVHQLLTKRVRPSKARTKLEAGRSWDGMTVRNLIYALSWYDFGAPVLVEACGGGYESGVFVGTMSVSKCSEDTLLYGDYEPCAEDAGCIKAVVVGGKQRVKA